MTRAGVLRGDAGRLPFADGTIDCIVCSPPFWGQRSYEDGGAPIPGQLGSEPDWREYLENLWALTAEWARVLSPAGSMFINIGDKHSERGHGPNRGRGTGRGPQGGEALRQSRQQMEKSLLNLPHRYAIGCTDRLGLIQRAEIIWSKDNPVPSSAKDRVRRSHESTFHFTREPGYYQATDCIREPILHPGKSRTSGKARAAWQHVPGKGAQSGLDSGDENPLGKLPGSVWFIPGYALKAPRYYWRRWPAAGLEWVKDDPAAWRWLAANPARDRSLLPRDDSLLELRAAPDHYAAMPPALVRPLILGWSPERVCLACGQGRFPVTSYTGEDGRRGGGTDRYGRDLYSNLEEARLRGRAITGWACACTPVTNNGRSRVPSVTQSRMWGRGEEDHALRRAATGSSHHGNNWPERPPQYTYHFDGWEPPPSRPGRVLDPCGGTGTVAGVAAAWRRHGLTVDISGDYSLLATWRVDDPGEIAAALQVPRPKAERDGQGELFARGEVPADS